MQLNWALVFHLLSHSRDQSFSRLDTFEEVRAVFLLLSGNTWVQFKGSSFRGFYQRQQHGSRSWSRHHQIHHMDLYQPAACSESPPNGGNSRVWKSLSFKGEELCDFFPFLCPVRVYVVSWQQYGFDTALKSMQLLSEKTVQFYKDPHKSWNTVITKKKK